MYSDLYGVAYAAGVLAGCGLPGGGGRGAAQQPGTLNITYNPTYMGLHARQVYWLDVDYLVVAGAALRCGACFTALLYLEHHCEAAHGRLVLGDDQPLAAVHPYADASYP